MSRIQRTPRARIDAAENWFSIAQNNDAAGDKLFFTRSGLEERLTGFEPPRVVTEILS